MKGILTMKGSAHRAFTLIEMLVVIGIISVLMGASVAGFMKMAKAAERAKTQELVTNVATALTAMYQQEGSWPRRLAENGETGGLLDSRAAYAFVSGTTKYLSLSQSGGQLAGHDRFGIITPEAMKVVKKLGGDAKPESNVGSVKVKDHILHYAVDIDGDGKIVGASVGGENVNVRATAIVWCIGKSGGNKGEPWPYREGLRRDDVYSWTRGQTRDVQ